MKKSLIILSVFVLMAIVSLSAVAEVIEKGYISVNESVTKEVSPNQVEISIGVETSDKSLQKASNDNKIIANRVYSKLKTLLGADDYIKTNNYSATPSYFYTKDNQRVLDKYIVSNTVVVKTKKMDTVSKLIDEAISQGANKVENLQFSAVDYDTICNSTLSEITKKAYTKADSVAKSINSQIVGIKSINATCNTDNSPRPFYAMAMKNAVDSVSSTPIESGKIKIYANVDASFYVK